MSLRTIPISWMSIGLETSLIAHMQCVALLPTYEWRVSLEHVPVYLWSILTLEQHDQVEIESYKQLFVDRCRNLTHKTLLLKLPNESPESHLPPRPIWIKHPSMTSNPPSTRPKAAPTLILEGGYILATSAVGPTHPLEKRLLVKNSRMQDIFQV